MKPRQKPIKRTRIRKHPRKPSEFARIYGSKERVEWVRRLRCVYCEMIYGEGSYDDAESYNAHTENGGTGYKAGYKTIVPLCGSHHSAYDDHRPPLASYFIRQKLKAAAAEIQRKWEAHNEV